MKNDEGDMYFKKSSTLAYFLAVKTAQQTRCTRMNDVKALGGQKLSCQCAEDAIHYYMEGNSEHTRKPYCVEISKHGEYNCFLLCNNFKLRD
jgi:hypothetical protein